jgi:hypothetical protein
VGIFPIVTIRPGEVLKAVPKNFWYALPDGTCLCLECQLELASGKLTVGRLVLGEKGKGYGGKLVWGQQKHASPDRVDLEGYRRPPASQPAAELRDDRRP